MHHNCALSSPNLMLLSHVPRRDGTLHHHHCVRDVSLPPMTKCNILKSGTATNSTCGLLLLTWPPLDGTRLTPLIPALSGAKCSPELVVFPTWRRIWRLLRDFNFVFSDSRHISKCRGQRFTQCAIATTCALVTCFRSSIIPQRHAPRLRALSNLFVRAQCWMHPRRTHITSQTNVRQQTIDCSGFILNT